MNERKDSSLHLPRILVAEDDLEMRKLLGWSLKKKGYDVVECQDGNCLLKRLGILGKSDIPYTFDLIISDVRMPGATGLEVLESAREFEDFPPMILITAFPDQEAMAQAKRLGAAAMFAKPFDLDELLNKVKQIIPAETSLTESGKNSAAKKHISLHFPLEITFRHHSGSEPVKDFVQDMTAKLNRFYEHIEHCHVVIDELDPHHPKKHYYQVNIALKTAGKTLVATHETDKGFDDENLYIAIQMAFSTLHRHLKNYLHKHNNNRAKS